MKKASLTFLTLLLSIIIVHAQDTLYAKRIICDLADKELLGRGWAHEGNRLAADYLKKEFEAIGVPYSSQSFLDTNWKMEGEHYFMLDGKKLKLQEDYNIPFFTCNSNGDTMEIIKAGIEHIFYIAKDKKLMKKIEKATFPVMLLFDMADLSCKKYSDEDRKNYRSYVRFLQYKQTEYHPKVAAVAFQESVLSGYSTRYVPEKEFRIVHIKKEMLTKKSKYAQLLVHNKAEEVTVENFIVELKGKMDSTVIFSAHYDHLGLLGDDHYFPGANDNASGVAYLFDLIRYYQKNPPKYNMVFLFFDGEESGLLGSEYYTQNPTIDLQKVKQVMNLDLMCGGSKGLMIFNATDTLNIPIMQKMGKVNEQYNISPIVKRDNAPNSDHYHFTQMGIPAVFILTRGGTKGQGHHYTDTCENCPLEGYPPLFQMLVECFE